MYKTKIKKKNLVNWSKFAERVEVEAKCAILTKCYNVIYYILLRKLVNTV